jgi:hypothetical protein
MAAPFLYGPGGQSPEQMQIAQQIEQRRQAAQGQAAGSPSANSFNLDGAGLSAQFDSLLQNMRAIPGQINTAIQEIPAGAKTAASRTARYAPGGAVALGQFGQGNIIEGLGATGGTALAGRLVKNLLPSIPGGPIVKGAVALGASLLGGEAGGAIGHAVSGIGGQLAGGLGQLLGGAQVAAQGAVQGAANLQREGGQAAGTGAQAGVPSSLAQQQAINYARQMGVNLPREYLEQNYQIMQKYKDADLSRLMQTQQQTAMLQGQLNQQIISGQLASGAQTQAGATTRDILNNNPYQQAVLNTGSTRGI